MTCELATNDVNRLVWIFAPVIIVVATSGLAWFWRNRERLVADWKAADHPQRMLAEWAGKTGVKLIESERCAWRKQPFWIFNTEGQVVYRVKAEYPDGRTRRAWVRCGDPLWGTLCYDVEVRWDEEAPKQPVIFPNTPRAITIPPLMNVPMVGSWSVAVREVRPFTIHGDLYYELHALRTDEPADSETSSLFALRVPQHASQFVPQAGDHLVVTFLMGQVTAVKKMTG